MFHLQETLQPTGSGEFSQSTRISLELFQSQAKLQNHNADFLTCAFDYPPPPLQGHPTPKGARKTKRRGGASCRIKQGRDRANLYMMLHTIFTICYLPFACQSRSHSRLRTRPRKIDGRYSSSRPVILSSVYCTLAFSPSYRPIQLTRLSVFAGCMLYHHVSSDQANDANR